MEKKIMLGNEAFARGAYEAGVKVVSSYPGTPSTEVTETMAKYKEVHTEWAPNEKCGGSQAIGALAFGTESIPAVDVIVGPGNKFVAEAKKLVYGTVGIDMVAGPTEVFIIADKSADPEWVAADLLAQAEHDVVAQPVLALTDENLAKKVSAEIEKQLETLATAAVARQSIDSYGRIILLFSKPAWL